MNSRCFALLALMTLMLSACHSPAQKAAAPVTDACEVLTPAEIGAALGVSIDPGKPMAGKTLRN